MNSGSADPSQRHRTAAWVSVVTALALVGCSSEDRSPNADPSGDWHRIAEGSHGDVAFTLWETESSSDNATCLSWELSTDMIDPLPSYETELHKGRFPACVFLPSPSDPVSVEAFNPGDHMLLSLPPDWTPRTLTLSDGDQVENAATEDGSDDINVFVGFFEPPGYPETLDVDTPDGPFTCVFKEGRYAPKPACERT